MGGTSTRWSLLSVVLSTRVLVAFGSWGGVGTAGRGGGCHGTLLGPEGTDLCCRPVVLVSPLGLVGLPGGGVGVGISVRTRLAVEPLASGVIGRLLVSVLVGGRVWVGAGWGRVSPVA
jgi:hypothetical protein